MSWASGSGLFVEIISVMKNKLDDDDLRQSLYYDLIELFENYDCDTLDECRGEDKAFDAAYTEYVEDNYDEASEIFLDEDSDS